MIVKLIDDRQSQLMSWPRKEPVPSPPSTPSAPWWSREETKRCTVPTSDPPTPLSWTLPQCVTSWARGVSATSWWEAAFTARGSCGRTFCRVPSPTCLSDSLCTTACLTCSSWPPSHSWSRSPTGDSLASGTTDSDGASPRTNSANTTTPVCLKSNPSGVLSNPAAIEKHSKL